jgi:hypothetical protein
MVQSVDYINECIKYVSDNESLAILFNHIRENSIDEIDNVLIRKKVESIVQMAINHCNKHGYRGDNKRFGQYVVIALCKTKF